VSETLTVRYVAPPTVSRFLDSNARFRCIRGPFGSGKSTGCLFELLIRALGQEPSSKDKLRKTRFAIIRNTYRELEDTTRKTFEKWMPLELGNWRESDFAFDFEFNDVRCEVMFRALDRPQHIKKLLSLDLTGAYVNEIREIPKHIIDALDGRIGRYPAMDEGGPTWKGIWSDSNPWNVGHWLDETEKKKLPGRAFFRQPGGREPDAENVANLPEGYYTDLCVGKDQEWIDSYVDGKDPKAAVGSIYGDLVTAMEEAQAICEFDHGADGVFTSWDLGRADATAIWFWRVAGRDRIDVIDYYESNFKKLAHYCEVVEKKGYEYVNHWLPHDGKAKTLASELSIEDQLRERWPGKVGIGPNLSVADGIAATRWLLDGRCRIHSRCKEGIQVLRSYRRKYDELLKAYSREPVHDWASNGADAARYMAVVVRGTELLMREEKKPEPTQADRTALRWLQENPNHPNAKKVAQYLETKGLAHAPRDITLDEMWEQKSKGGRERI
jgi:hypothetical protein